MLSIFFIWALFALQCRSTYLSSLTGKGVPSDLVSPAPDILPRNDPIYDDKRPFHLAGASESDIQEAKKIVDAAIRKATLYNKARLERPSQTTYLLKSHRKGRSTDGVAPLFEVTDDIATAAALLAEADAYEKRRKSGWKRLETRQRTSRFWMANISHRGSWPFGNNDPNYRVRQIHPWN